MASKTNPNEKHNLDLYYQEAVNIAKIAGKLVREAFYSEKRIDTKDHKTDLVTETDQESERIIKKHFKEKFPSHSFIGEESVAGGEKCNLTDNPTWIIDPIDGTTNFVHKFPFSAISIALAINKELVVGVIYNPILDEMFSAITGHGATCNGKPIKPSNVTEINQALLITEIGASREQNRINGIMKNLQKIITEPYMARGIRSLGSAALNMCYVAAGRADAYYEFGIHCWDIAAGIVILKEAGGMSFGATGEPVDIMAREIVCAGSEVLCKKICNAITRVPHIRD
ncbi:inositol monophosphatase 1-like [Dendronephthya gigantea]|uniref:inositol monophosphatase 1-like n=1 Tax=Dendronephthya gigantea TaxID=151771 RepID=UPI001068DD5B|nr:inositol monophosphatase 1-like [Dendronephthya gigantea]